ncbi:nucleoside hydrolase [Candidatus Woesearchaeota archaeon]|nr:nucleoside hydrolase [Candidatus Woesearchaeota archaeon]
MEKANEKLIIDTDIGSDVDDALAILYAVKAGMPIALISTSHGDTALRAKIAKKLTLLLGQDIPVAAGEQKPMKQRHVYWDGDEGEGLVEEEEQFDFRQDGVDAIAETIHANRNNISIASIAPMTNIARAFQKYPELPEMVNALYIMGNALLCGDTYHLNYRAHNFKADPEAADIVLAAAVPKIKIIVTTEVCKKSWLTKEDFERLREQGHVGAYLYAAAQNWLRKSMYDVAYLYDPLVVHHHVDAEMTTRVKHGTVEITTDVQKHFKQQILTTMGTVQGSEVRGV